MTGLTNEEVQERIAQGQVNNNENPNTRTYKQIILENTLTFFNFLNLVLLVLVLLVGSYKNSMFVGIIFINTVIGIIQEIRAKKTIDKLAILTGVYTGGGEKVWVFYTRTVRVFGERLNEALAPFELLPISIYTEMDPDWEEYKDMYEMKEWAVD